MSSVEIGIFYRTKIVLNAASLTLMAGFLLSCLLGSFDTNVGFRENKNHMLANQGSELDTAIHDLFLPKFGSFGFLYVFFLNCQYPRCCAGMSKHTPDVG